MESLPGFSRDFSGSLVKPVVIFNNSFREGFIRQVLKSADVVPLSTVILPERLDKDLWPICLTPIISKVQEQFIHKWLWEVIQHLLDSSHYGAIKGSCLTFAMIMMLHDWLKSTDNAKR